MSGYFSKESAKAKNAPSQAERHYLPSVSPCHPEQASDAAPVTARGIFSGGGFRER
jgi:hypothetical protein